jgi:hypothetical protein
MPEETKEQPKPEQPEPLGYAIKPALRSALLALLDTLPRGTAQPLYEALVTATPLVPAGQAKGNRKTRRTAVSKKKPRKKRR